jgi:hypothetical protein
MRKKIHRHQTAINLTKHTTPTALTPLYKSNEMAINSFLPLEYSPYASRMA